MLTLDNVDLQPGDTVLFNKEPIRIIGVPAHSEVKKGLLIEHRHGVEMGDRYLQLFRVPHKYRGKKVSMYEVRHIDLIPTFPYKRKCLD